LLCLGIKLNQHAHSYEISGLANGSFVYGLNTTGTVNSIMIDSNGLQGPNEVGQDLLYIVLCASATGCNGNVNFNNSTVVPFGKITNRLNTFTSTAYLDANTALYQRIFSRQ
jgi:hypothetical protein